MRLSISPACCSFALITLIVAGCHSGTRSTSSNTTIDSPASSNTTMTELSPVDGTPEAPSGVALQIGDAADLAQLVANRKGKVVLVDYWATWCPPCMKKFPHVVELGKQHADQGLQIISVSVDDPDNQERVLEFLQQQQATFPNLLAKEGGSNATFEDFDIPAGVPFYVLYDEGGQIRHRFGGGEGADGIESPDNLDTRVGELLTSKNQE